MSPSLPAAVRAAAEQRARFPGRLWRRADFASPGMPLAAAAPRAQSRARGFSPAGIKPALSRVFNRCRRGGRASAGTPAVNPAPCSCRSHRSVRAGWIFTAGPGKRGQNGSGDPQNTALASRAQVTAAAEEFAPRGSVASRGLCHLSEKMTLPQGLYPLASVFAAASGSASSLLFPLPLIFHLSFSPQSALDAPKRRWSGSAALAAPTPREMQLRAQTRPASVMIYCGYIRGCGRARNEPLRRGAAVHRDTRGCGGLAGSPASDSATSATGRTKCCSASATHARSAGAAGNLSLPKQEKAKQRHRGRKTACGAAIGISKSSCAKVRGAPSP